MRRVIGIRNNSLRQCRGYGGRPDTSAHVGLRRSPVQDAFGCIEPFGQRQVLRAQEFRVEQLRLIARAGSHRMVTMVWPGPSSRARRIAPAMLMPVEPPRHRPSSSSRSKTIGSASSSGMQEGDVEREAFEVGGDAALADAFGDRAALGLELAGRVVSCRAPRPADRRARSSTSGFCALSAIGDAGQRAAGADRADEAVDLAAGLLPDLRAGRARHGRRGWRHCRTGWPRSRRSARSRASCSASRAATSSRNCWGSCRAPPAPRSARRRAAAACPSSPGSACRE